MKYLNKENVITFVIVLLAIVAAPYAIGFVNKAKSKVTGK
jgi:hypothetical protein